MHGVSEKGGTVGTLDLTATDAMAVCQTGLPASRTTVTPRRSNSPPLLIGDPVHYPTPPAPTTPPYPSTTHHTGVPLHHPPHYPTSQNVWQSDGLRLALARANVDVALVEIRHFLERDARLPARTRKVLQEPVPKLVSELGSSGAASPS